VGEVRRTAPETLDLIREGVEAFNRRDLEGMLETMDPEIELVPLRGAIEGIAYHGHEGVRNYMKDMANDWQDSQIEIAALRELGDGRVLVDAQMRAHTLGTGVEVAATGAWLCDVSGDKVKRIRFYRDAESALEAAANREAGG
jgi:ketosteroid isomerase-like protein